jgi:hypothetical protein
MSEVSSQLTTDGRLGSPRNREPDHSCAGDFQFLVIDSEFSRMRRRSIKLNAVIVQNTLLLCSASVYRRQSSSDRF